MRVQFQKKYLEVTALLCLGGIVHDCLCVLDLQCNFDAIHVAGQNMVGLGTVILGAYKILQSLLCTQPRSDRG